VTAVVRQRRRPDAGVDASAVPAPEKFPHGSGFWAVALAFPIVMENRPAGSRRPARLPVPAAAATLAAFSAMGLFAGLSGLFLTTTDFMAVRVPEVAS